MLITFKLRVNDSIHNLDLKANIYLVKAFQAVFEIIRF